MKPRIFRMLGASVCGVTLVMLVSLAEAAAPAGVGDSLLYQFNDRLGPVAPTTTSLTLLRADGTFQEVWTRDFLGYGSEFTTPPANGTYTYVVSGSDPAQATLTLNATALGLTFLDGTSGTIGSAFWTFRLYPAWASEGATNVSNRVWVRPDNTAVTGFVVGGTTARWVLVRAAGPALVDLGVPVVVANPSLRLFRDSGEPETFGRWSADPNLVPGMSAVFAFVGAFPFASGSTDCAALVRLEPGGYTLHCGGATSEAEVLMEVYILPVGG